MCITATVLAGSVGYATTARRPNETTRVLGLGVVVEGAPQAQAADRSGAAQGAVLGGGSDRPGDAAAALGEVLWTLGSMYVPAVHADGLPAPQLDVPPARQPAVPEFSEPRIGGAIDVCVYSWPCAEAESVMQCESSGNPDAVNGSSVGLFQVNLAAHPYTAEEMRDPEQNVAAAYAIWSDQGWEPWSCEP